MLYAFAAYILADRGYDVWLANCRGSSFGKHHTNLTIYDSQFWQFTLIDIGTKVGNKKISDISRGAEAELLKLFSVTF